MALSMATVLMTANMNLILDLHELILQDSTSVYDVDHPGSILGERVESASDTAYHRIVLLGEDTKGSNEVELSPGQGPVENTDPVEPVHNHGLRADLNRGLR
ncbi:hypothetical protein LWI28_019635 [Acer negundo]|uniref:Uncharacterized protein n=1 Tax=Acer negundo TaxID=4023 RepID=A0AAD5JDY8_ACENE|nr:hypothetical protein LWI28_019635 [Acer negundo]